MAAARTFVLTALLLVTSAISPAQSVPTVEFAIPTAQSDPIGITVGPDGALWFTEYSSRKIGRITPSGAFTEYKVLDTGGISLGDITAGPDALWFTESDSNSATNKIGRITTAGVIAYYTVPSFGGITAGPDGALWFADPGSNKIGRITTDGMITEYVIPTSRSDPKSITTGPDSALWFTEANKIGRITTAGAVTEYSIGTSPGEITAGPDGALWFTETGNKIGRITTAGAVTEYPVGKFPVGITAGPDGALWFIEGNPNAGAQPDIGRITTAGAFSEYSINGFPDNITAGPDGALWFTDSWENAIGRLQVVYKGGVPMISSVISLSGFGALSMIAPGSWIEIHGSNLATTLGRGWTGADFNGNNAPTSLDGVGVSVGGQAAFVEYISSDQVNTQVSSNIGTGPQPVIVTTTVGSSASYTITVDRVQPGMLAPSSTNIGGTQYAAAFFPDGTLVLPEGALPCTASHRARPGDLITFYGVGFGPVSPAIPAGEIVQQTNTLNSAFSLSLGQTPATLLYSGLAPLSVGLYQFNVVVPAISSSDPTPLTFSLADVSGTQSIYTSVQDGGGAKLQSLSIVFVNDFTYTGTVVLSAPAPASGAVIALSSDSGYANVPCTITVGAGSISKTFMIDAPIGPYRPATTVKITALYNASASQAFFNLPCDPGSSGGACL